MVVLKPWSSSSRVRTVGKGGGGQEAHLEAHTEVMRRDEALNPSAAREWEKAGDRRTHKARESTPDQMSV